MAEIVGILASVLTLGQTASEGVRIAKSMYNAPRELEMLQVRCTGEPNGALC